MKMIRKSALATTIATALLAAGVAQANVSADKAAALGNSLTPMGSEKAGNAAGTIPAWDGGITRAPAGYKAGRDHVDPYSGDKPLFTITAANMGQYAGSLGAGQKAMFGQYYKPGNTSESINNTLLYFKQDVLGPARLAGGVLLVHETLNAKAQPRQAWVYNPGQRRVRRAPNVAYDNPGTASDGLRTNDMTDMFNGAMDRFSWTLVGKKEMLIPYNDYKADSSKTKVSDLVKPGHINPDDIRYELHRVWVIEANLKPGQRHINSRRTFYLDEDSWQIVGIDHYDGQKQLWRYSEALPINYYEVPTLWTTLETHYDLKTGRYISGLLDNQDKPRDFSFMSTPADYSPQNLRDSGIR